MITKSYKTTNTNKCVLFVNNGNYAFKSIYYSTPDGIPDPIIGSIFNSHFLFISKDYGQVTVDWDDGNVETYNMQKSTNGYYIIAWRCLHIDYRKNPMAVGGGWEWGKDVDTNEYIRPLPNHEYVDGENRERHISIKFTCIDLYNFSTKTCVMSGFPIIEFENLTYLYIANTVQISEIPFVRISKLKKLTSLTLSALGSRLQIIPDAIFEMTNLTNLNVSSIFNLSDPDASQLRKIKNLKNLQSFAAWSTNITKYIKEFNELPKLTSLTISDSSGQYGVDGYPTFEEVSEINQNLTSFYILSASYSGNGRRTSWMEDELSGKKLQNLFSFNVEYQKNITLELPEYLKQMSSLKSFYLTCALTSLERADTFVNNFYDYILNWDQMTMTNTLLNGERNQFYGLSVIMYLASSPNDFRPSGIEQAPTGFVLGVSNGNPQTPMEKIYVLKNNYKQVWTVKPETATVLEIDSN